MTHEIRRLLRLAWPVALGHLGMIGMGVVDTIMVGRLGDEELAGVGLGHSWSFAVAIVSMGTASGLDPLMSQPFGAGRPTDAVRAFLRGLVVLAVLAVPSVMLHFAAGAGLTALGEPAELVPIAGLYCGILGWAVVPWLAFSACRHLLQADGLMRPAMWIILVANVINLVADWALIYGHLGAPALGVAGAAWATVLSRGLMAGALVAVSAWVARDRWLSLGTGTISLRGVLSPRELWSVASVALPVGLQAGLEGWAFVVTSFMAGRFGATAMAAHVIALNLASVAFMLVLGLSAAAATRVGKLIGRRQHWGPAARAALVTCLGFTLFSASLFALFPEFLGGIYTKDVAVLGLILLLLPIAAAFQVFDGAQVVISGLLRGAGDTRIPMLSYLVGYWLLGLPVGAFIAFKLQFGVRGLWVGLSIGLAAASFLLLMRLRWALRRAPATTVS